MLPILLVPLTLLWLVSLCRIFTKAEKPWIAGLIPFYALLVWQEITNRGKLFALLLFVPFLNLPVWIIMNVQLARVFGRGPLYGYGMALLPVVFTPALAFGSGEYTRNDEPQREPISTYLLATLLSLFVFFGGLRSSIESIIVNLNGDFIESGLSFVEPAKLSLDGFTEPAGTLHTKGLIIDMPRKFVKSEEQHGFDATFVGGGDLLVEPKTGEGDLTRFDTFAGNFNISEVPWNSMTGVRNDNELLDYLMTLKPDDVPFYLTEESSSLYRNAFRLKNKLTWKSGENLYSFEFSGKHGYQFGLPGKTTVINVVVMGRANRRVDLTVEDPSLTFVTQRDLNTIIRSIAISMK